MFSREAKKIPASPVTVLTIIFILLMVASTYTGEAPDYSSRFLSRNLKTLVLSLAILALINSRTRLHSLIWVITISLGYYGVKGGAFMVATGGQYNIYGPANTMIGDNNLLATALVLTLPLVNYLRIETENKWIRRILLGVMIFTAFAVLGSYSRGGFLAIAGLSFLFWWRSKSKVLSLVFILALGSMAAAFMPDKYFDRLNTIETAVDEDGSFIGRLEAWQTAIAIAGSRPLGVGFRAYQKPHVFGKYAPPGIATKALAMHSIYFEVLGDHGYGGLILYLLIGFLTWRNTRWVYNATRGQPELEWARNLALMMELSIAGFAIGGAALSLAYYDVYWAVVAMAASLRLLVKRKLTTMDAHPESSFVPAHGHASETAPDGTTAQRYR
ncbi:MAG TPA: putative O-glycosylation ligase, exosortase A system-associated [Sneathiellales bacterium]|nr:putative O-glycosylation ligase, exosortase A system-associated [Sneathiellales bacterium]